MLTGNYKALYERLTVTIDQKRIFHDLLHTLTFGTDASFYGLVPKMTIRAKDEKEVLLIFQVKCFDIATKLLMPDIQNVAAAMQRIWLQFGKIKKFSILWEGRIYRMVR